MLTKKAIDKIQENPMCQSKISIATGKSVDTVQRWLRENSNLVLTSQSVLDVIKKETGLTVKEIVAY